MKGRHRQGPFEVTFFTPNTVLQTVMIQAGSMAGARPVGPAAPECPWLQGDCRRPATHEPFGGAPGAGRCPVITIVSRDSKAISMRPILAPGLVLAAASMRTPVTQGKARQR